MRKLQAQKQISAHHRGSNKRITFASLAIVLLLLNSCAPSSKLVTWTDPERPHPSLSKILVIAVVHDSLNGIRKNVEDYFVQALMAMGHHAEASLETFGSMASARLNQEGTYLNLCNQGIDAVLTIALLNKQKATDDHAAHERRNAGSYYYNRLLRYGALRATPQDQIDPSPDQLQFLWEVTLFNLSTLTPLYWSQTKPFSPAVVKQNHETYCRIILTNLQKQKIIGQRSKKGIQ